jgi:hypothetical protein
MGDRCPNSLVFCHAHGAQNLEFRWLAVPGRLCKAFWGVGEIAGKIFIARKLFINRWKGQKSPISS